MILPRPLTQAEYQLVKWMIEHGDCDSNRYLSQLDKAQVYRHCQCGCASVDFKIGDHSTDSKAGLEILADFLYGDGPAGPFGAFVFAKDGWLAGLEVYSLSGGGTPKVLPKPEDLRSFDCKKEDA